jgi:hypothetical protein
LITDELAVAERTDEQREFYSKALAVQKDNQLLLAVSGANYAKKAKCLVCI